MEQRLQLWIVDRFFDWIEKEGYDKKYPSEQWPKLLMYYLNNCGLLMHERSAKSCLKKRCPIRFKIKISPRFRKTKSVSFTCQVQHIKYIGRWLREVPGAINVIRKSILDAEAYYSMCERRKIENTSWREGFDGSDENYFGGDWEEHCKRRDAKNKIQAQERRQIQFIQGQRIGEN